MAIHEVEMDKYDELEMRKFEVMEGFEEKEINLWEYWAMFWKRKWLILAVTIIVLGLAAYKSYTTDPTYKAFGILSIEREPNILSFEDMFQFETARNQFLETQYRILKSRSLVSEVIDRLNGSMNEEVPDKKKSTEGLEVSSRVNTKSGQINSFLGKLEVEPIENTWLVEVVFTALEPDLAADAVNTLFDTFIERNIRDKYASTEEAAEFLKTQIERLRKNIDRKERELQRYGAESDIVALSDEETTIIDKLGDLNSALTRAQIERINKETTYNEIRGASADYVPEAITNPLIQQLRKDYVALNREYAKKQEQWGPEYPEIQRLKTEIENIKQQLDRETNNWIRAAYADYQAALKQEESLGKVFNEQKQAAFNLKSNAILYNSLKIEIENAKSMRESLMRRESETGISARLRGMKTSSIKVVDRAEVPLSPFKPNKKKNMIMGLLIGLFGGLGLAYLLDYMDNSIKTSKDIEKYVKLPSLGVVPAFSSNGVKKAHSSGIADSSKLVAGSKKEAHSSLLVAGSKNEAFSSQLEAGSKNREETQSSLLMGDSQNEDEEERKKKKEKKQKIETIELIPYFLPKSTYSESYRSIRTALLLSSADKDLKAIAVSSPLPREGKTATVSNLAVTLAQMDKKVLLVDSDLRKPRLHRIFNMKNLNGLTNFLTSDIRMKELIKPTEIENLYLINSGPVPPNPAELLNSDKMSNFIEILKQSFDYILFDTPPILAVSDALVLSTKVDGMILIVWGEKTSREALIKAKEKLDMANVKTLGAIINNLKIRKHDYYYKLDYYYKYYGEDQEGL